MILAIMDSVLPAQSGEHPRYGAVVHRLRIWLHSETSAGRSRLASPDTLEQLRAPLLGPVAEQPTEVGVEASPKRTQCQLELQLAETTDKIRQQEVEGKEREEYTFRLQHEVRGLNQELAQLKQWMEEKNRVQELETDRLLSWLRQSEDERTKEALTTARLQQTLEKALLQLENPNAEYAPVGRPRGHSLRRRTRGRKSSF